MSSKVKDVFKNGWHPEKEGTTLRGQMSGMLGRNKSDSSSSNHVAQPLSSLRDPSSFAPPPKRTGSGLAPPPPPSSTAAGTRKVVPAPSKYQDPRAPAVEPPPRQTYLPQQEQGVVADEDRPPPQPYRVNTSGLSTDHLPRPPGRRDGANGKPPPPPSYDAATGARPAPTAAPPRLPPRLPPRTNSGSSAPVLAPLSPDGSSSNILNQGAVSRLGAAGISVPGLGIGRTSPATASSPSPPPPPRPAATASPVNELQNRFSRLGTGSPTSTEPPTQGTTWAQKQAALKTVSSFNKDPSSVSLADARSAASTANNFRQRHGDQVAAGMQKAQGYGLVDKAAGLAGQNPGQTGQVGALAAGLAGKKKPPPPPPPKKKPGFNSPVTPSGADDEPPPIPIATKPTF